MYIIFHDRRNQFLNPGDQAGSTGRVRRAETNGELNGIWNNCRVNILVYFQTLLRGVTLGTVACKVLNLICQVCSSLGIALNTDIVRRCGKMCNLFFAF